MELRDYSTNNLIDELRNRGFINVYWSVEDIKYVLPDILERPKYTGIELKEEDLENIRTRIEENWDASIGINWNEIEGFIMGYLDDKFVFVDSDDE